MNKSLDRSRNECGKTKNILKVRTKVACEFCRKRKIKCNGAQPCSNCVNGCRGSCTYPKRIKERRTTAKHVSNTKTVQLLNKRIGSIESVLRKIASRFDDIKKGEGEDGGQEKEGNNGFGIVNGLELKEKRSLASEASSVGVENETITDGSCEILSSRML